MTCEANGSLLLVLEAFFVWTSSFLDNFALRRPATFLQLSPDVQVEAAGLSDGCLGGEAREGSSDDRSLEEVQPSRQSFKISIAIPSQPEQRPIGCIYTDISGSNHEDAVT